MVNDFYLGALDISRLNYGVITLVPKVQDANNVKQFRPICLLNISFKVFTKLLMTRLTDMADKLISKAQTAFVRGRYILDGAVMLHEVMHELRVKKKQGVIFKIDFEKAYDSINWGFVEEVLTRKGFDPKFKHWIMSTVRGGKVCVNVNGENGSYFRTHRGLRQGDPLSPLLFNLAADALDLILRKAKHKGHIKGVVPELIPGGLTHLQYADDTVILMNLDDQTLSNMKFLLYCFEWVTGLKINYHKSEVLVFGADSEEQQRVANILNCKVGTLPMHYLGLPISDRHLGAHFFTGITDKMRKKLSPWKGKLLSLGGRLVLTNSSLSSIPTYTMGMYRLGEGVHQKMDTIRSQFFWRGPVINLNITW